MKLICSTDRRTGRRLAIGLVTVVVSMCAAPAYAQRVFGLDTSSAANTNAPSQTAWNNAFNDADGDGVAYKFAFVRSSRGGTTDATRLDDAHFYDNITRGTNAGMLVGSYHFTRADVSTHTAADDANHYLERTAMYMKPGYLLPVYDLESGNTLHSAASLTAWGMEFMNTIFNAQGFYPIVYTNSSYNNDEVLDELAFFDHASDPTPHTQPRTFQWVARPSGNLQTGEPGAATSYPNPYGVWDPNFVTRTNSRDPAVNPWAFWQNGSGSPNGFLIDFNAANGNIEFVKDFLVPALWTNAGSGDWGTTANWNSDNPTYDGTIQSGPAPRLPNNQNLDWVKLQNSGDGTVTISSGARTVRKFYTQQPLNITGGSLTVNYVPGSGGKWDLPSEFNAAVTLSSGASYSARTTQVDGGGGQFNINGGTVTFTEIQLASHASNSGKIVMGGDATFAQTGGTGTSVIRSTGSLAQAGSISLSAGNRTFTVNNGSAGVDLNVRAAITGAGRLVKSGAGTMQLSTTNTYGTFGGGTTISSGVLQIAADDRLGTAPGIPQTNNIILDGGTLRTGAQINSASLTNAGSGYTSFPSLSIGGAGADVHPASANVLAGMTSIAVTAGGSGYVNQNPASPPAQNTAGTFVDIVGGGGTGATAYATVVGGVVTAITIANPGTGYTSMPTIHISSTISGGSLAGSGAAANVSGISLQSIALNDGGFDYTTPTISLTGGGGTGATASATSSPTLTLNSNRGIELTANGGTLYQTTGTTLTVGGVISSSGNGALTKSGPGTLTLSGANTYTGNTIINGGVLRTGANERLPDITRVTVTSPGSFDVNGFSETIGSLEGNGSVTNFNLLVAGGDDSSTTFSGTLSGGSLRKTGAGTMTLSGSNSYSGGTNVVEGTLRGSSIANQGANSSFGTSNFSIANGATLEYTGPNASTNRTIFLDTGGGIVSVPSASLTVNGVISGSALTKAGAGTLTLGGANTYAGSTTINNGTLRITGNERVPNTSRVTVSSSGTFNVNNLIETIGSLEGDGSVTNFDDLTTGGDDTSTTFSGTLDGNSLTKTGTGTMALSGSNGYSATYILGGTLSGNSIADQFMVSAFGTGNFSIGNGAALEYTGSNASTNRTISLDTGGGSVSVSNAGSLTVNGVVSGTALTKSGAGTMALTGSNSYAGGTSVFDGTLSGNSIADQGTSSAFGTGNFAIANGATLEYTGPTASTNRSILLDPGGGIISVASGAAQLNMSGIIAGSALTKAGAGSLILSGVNTYTGGTVVNAGLFALTGAAATLGSGDVTVLGAPVGSGLLIQSGVANAIDDAAALNLFGGGAPDIADEGFAFLDTGITEIVGSLFLNGVMQPIGTYGATGSGATHILDEYFGGSGILQVGIAPPIFPGDYNGDDIVDAADYVVWRKSVGEPAGTLPNDDTGLPIGDDQYDLWVENFGNSDGGAGGDAGVPEPSSIAMLMLGVAAIAGRRFRGL